MKKYLLKIAGLISEGNKKVIRDILLKTLNNLGLNTLFGSFNRGKLIILFFHGISRKEFQYHHRRYIPLSTFVKILNYLTKKDYSFITLTEWLNTSLLKKPPCYNYVILTFDDGLKSVIDNAYPILINKNAKGCFYITSGAIADFSSTLARLFRTFNKKL